MFAISDGLFAKVRSSLSDIHIACSEPWYEVIPSARHQQNVYYQINITVLTIPTPNIPPNPTFLATAAPLLGSEVIAPTIELDGVVPTTSGYS
jgi:hypothetical protein